MELYKGNVIIRGRSSPKALKSTDLALMEIEGGGDLFDYNPADVNGFIRINAVSMKMYAALRAKDAK
jgi:argininosuccinate synthase